MQAAYAIQSILHIIVALKCHQLQMMECLEEVCLRKMRKSLGMDQEHPLVVFVIGELAAVSLDMLQETLHSLNLMLGENYRFN